MNYLRNILILTLFAFFCAGELAARSYFLPDYQNKAYKARTNEGPVKDVLTPECTNFPNTYSAVQPGKNCRSSSPYPGLNCYYCLGCSSEYDEECETGYIRDENDICMDDGVTKYKCVKNPCAGMTPKTQCNNTVAGGYCFASEVEGCEDYCESCDENYCDAMITYGGATSCENGCVAGQEVEGCEGLCLECKAEELSCSNNKDGNFVDASGLTSSWDSTKFEASPYSSECVALGYNVSTCDPGYFAVGCPFNTTATAGHFYHCVLIETSAEDTVETCPDGYSTEVTSDTCTGDWTTLVNDGKANGKSCNKCDCLFSSVGACSNGDLGCEAQTIGGKICYVPLCKEGWEALMPSQVEQKRTTCKEDGNDWNSWDASSYCYRCDVEWQYCDDGYYSIYNKEAYDIKNEGEGNYLCKPQIGANAYEWCVQCEVCHETGPGNTNYKKYTNFDIWLDDKQNCEESGKTWQKADEYGCYYGCKTSGDSPDAPDTPATVEGECQKMDNMFHSRAVAETECVDYGAMKAVTSECYSCLNVYDDIQITWDVSFIPSSACDDVGNTYTYDEASSICDNNYQSIDVACITDSGEHRYCCTNTSSGTLCD